MLKQIEACINSRPLCAITSDSDERDYLTPGHFLIGRPLNLIPEPNIVNLNENTLDRWQKVQSAVQRFWARWHIEYLQSLQPRKKWTHEEPNLAVDDAVFIIDDRLPPAKWRLARVTEVHPGQDGLIRMATIKYPNLQPKGTRDKFIQLKRPIVKLCKLPIENVSLPTVADLGELVPDEQ